MTDLSSITSSMSSTISRQTASLGKAANATQKSFSDVMSKLGTEVGIKPKTGFVAGPTYEANTLVGQTKSAFNHAIDATKAALQIKP
ncbi:hypothetical protein [Bradyrhizobium sp. dw_78]|uniref:hypothetical protein n=1 Tax=Bradyrhizobium sp. dw_78 TaxID=2719793 RepID=UPI001BD68739|nr:hypothetical protein [Bradyrhizobium sp. dw_78]